MLPNDIKPEKPIILETIRFDEMGGMDGVLLKPDTNCIKYVPSDKPHPGDVSSKFKFKNCVDYPRELQYGLGRMMCTHISGKYIAYAVTIPQSPQFGMKGAVRITDLDTNERDLLKGGNGLVKDMEFMHKIDDLILGFIDECGAFFFFKIYKHESKLLHLLLFQVQMDGTQIRNDNRRLVWCKYVPDILHENKDDGTKDFAFNFAVLQDELVYVSNLGLLVSKFPEKEPNKLFSDIEGSYLTINGHSKVVVDASFAPDGTAICTASQDGFVKFFQVYLLGSDEKVRCLFTWKPHNGRPLARIIFLDDMSLPGRSDLPSQYWKYIVTASENMTEIKIWTCQTWDCLQTFELCSSSNWQLRMEMDISAKFLVMADIHHQTLFTMRINDKQTRVDWIQEFHVPFKIINFNIHKGKEMTLKEIHEHPNYSEFAQDEQNVMSKSLDDRFVTMEVFFVQPKSLQLGTVVFKPPVKFVTNGLENQPPPRSVVLETQGLVHDGDLLANLISNSVKLSKLAKKYIYPTKSESEIEAEEQAVSKLSEQLNTLIGLPAANIAIASEGLMESASPYNHRNILEQNVDQGPVIRTNGSVSKTSSSSSPSREVEEILSPKNAGDYLGRRSNPLGNPDPLLGFANAMDTENMENMDGNVTNEIPMPKLPKSMRSGKQKEVTVKHADDLFESLIDGLAAQTYSINELKSEIADYKSKLGLGLSPDDLSRMFAVHVAPFQSELQRIHESVKALELSEKQRGLQIARSISGNIKDEVVFNINKIVKDTLDTVWMPKLMNVMESTQTSVERLVISAETHLKQDLRNVLKGPEFKEAVIPEVGIAIRNICEGVITELLISTAIPRFEKTMATALEQVNEVFVNGTKDYLLGVGSLVDKDRETKDLKEMFHQKLSTVQESLTTTLCSELRNQMVEVAETLQIGVVRKLEESMSHELTRCFKEQQRYFEISVIPRAMTPAVTSIADHISAASQQDPYQLQKQAISLAKIGDVVGAFNLAVSSGNDSVVLSVCKEVTATKVFHAGFSSTLQNAILRTITVDLHNDTETKLMYLQTVIGTATTNDKNIIQNLSRVLPAFQRSVDKFSKADPNNKLIGTFRILEMALCGAGRTQSSASASISSDSQGEFCSAFRDKFL